MIKRLLSAIPRHFVRRGQTGQALVVLAIGFVGLLGFVGIVTDVSLLFIRYSTMRRAVDAASVAAAGQMRRVIDETSLSGSLPDDGIAQDEASSVASLNLAARQFIELYGLSPTNVLVETCRAQQVNRGAGPEFPPLDRNNVAMFNSDGSVNSLANSDDVLRYQELCTTDELKLVRVTAQIESPTVFMRLLGYDTITLTESAISQTAVIDVVLILDVSESMVNQTTYDDWDDIPLYDSSQDPQGVRYMPPYVHEWDEGDTTLVPPRNNPWNEILYNAQGQGENALATGLNYAINDPTDPANPLSRAYHIGDNLERFEPDGAGGYQAYTGPGPSPIDREEPREFCQVRAYTLTPYGTSLAPRWLRDEYFAYFGTEYSTQWGGASGDPDDPTGGQAFKGFVPQYNYYGCCNDPNGDFDFGDLVCQPFREARDAAEEFLARLDFLRGDRVAFVTFDRYATVIDPDGSGLQSAMIETEYDLLDTDGVTLLRRGANNVLNSVIGVRGEESTYHDDDLDGNWDTIMDGGTPSTYAELRDRPIGEFVDNPVAGACPYDKALAGPQFSTARTLPFTGLPRGNALLDDIHSVPSWYTGGLEPRTISYEYRGSCRGTNIGGSLASGSATLYNTGRREGAVWIMVLLSDGAAGASNPVTRDGLPPTEPQPYNLEVFTGYNDPLNALGGRTPLTSHPPAPAAYGRFGLCPYGTSTSGWGELLQDTIAPYCMDILPNTRTLCGTVAQNPGNIPLDMYPNCYEYYDVDDYARDWADWIGIAELPGVVTGTGTGRVTDQLLPTIFTIGFGLNFDNGACPATDYDCMRALPGRPTSALSGRRQDYLGEELLRYIADVGDNFQIDNDFWQKQMSSRIGNAPPEWGVRGSCEETTPANPLDPGNVYQPIPPAEDCGNYFAASGGAELELVFNEIASRMFTRLSQ